MEKKQKQEYAQLIWQKYCDKIENEWKSQQTKNFGELGKMPRNDVSVSLSEFLFEDFKSKSVKNGYSSQFMSSTSFYRILRTGINGSTQTETLNMFCYYLGVKGFDEFAETNKLSKISPIGDDKYNYKKWLGIGLVLIGLLSIIYYTINRSASTITYSNVEDLDAKTEKDVINFVRKAIDVEYKTYQKLPAIEVSELEKYYIDSCQAYWSGIIRITNVHHNLNLTITNLDNPSKYRIDTIKVVRVNADTIFVSTKEFWYLRWYNDTAKEYDKTRDRMRDFANEYGVLVKDDKKKIVSYKYAVAKRY